MRHPDDNTAAREELMSWLLDPQEPAARYRALVGLLGRSESEREVLRAQAEIPSKGWGAKILKEQKPGGFWESRNDLYRPKYIATIWNLIVLADLGVTASDERVRKSCELFLEEYSRPDGGFDSPSSNWKRSELCLTGNLARTLVLCGYADDRRVRSAFDWLVENQMDDGGWHCFYEEAFGRGTLDCWEGLSAFAALPKSR
jgi:prenyltransferase beta subunit